MSASTGRGRYPLSSRWLAKRRTWDLSRKQRKDRTLQIVLFDWFFGGDVFKLSDARRGNLTKQAFSDTFALTDSGKQGVRDTFTLSHTPPRRSATIRLSRPPRGDYPLSSRWVARARRTQLFTYSKLKPAINQWYLAEPDTFLLSDRQAQRVNVDVFTMADSLRKAIAILRAETFALVDSEGADVDREKADTFTLQDTDFRALVAKVMADVFMLEGISSRVEVASSPSKTTQLVMRRMADTVLPKNPRETILRARSM